MRKQNRRITVRMTEEQYRNLQDKIKISNTKQNDFILKSINDIQINVVDGLPTVIKELSAIGNNINQIAKICNMTISPPSLTQIEKLREEVNKIWQQLKQLKAVRH